MSESPLSALKCMLKPTITPCSFFYLKLGSCFGRFLVAAPVLASTVFTHSVQKPDSHEPAISKSHALKPIPKVLNQQQ